MKWHRRAMLIALLAPATTLAVAWTSALVVPVKPRSFGGTPSTSFGSITGQPKTWNGTLLSWQLQSTSSRCHRAYLLWPVGRAGGRVNDTEFTAALAASPFTDRIAEGAAVAADNPQVSTVYRADGWPFLAMSCDWPWFGGDPTSEPQVRGGISLNDAHDGSNPKALRAIPLRPLWPGLIANSAIYAVLWLGALVGIASLRRVLSSAPDTCHRCRHRLVRDQSICPECGAPRKSA
jgi:hypothetical protein